MSGQPVRAVFFARNSITNFRGIYGRDAKGDIKGYTHDYFQLADEAEQVLKEVFNSDGNPPFPLTYVWPGGSAAGHFTFSNDRNHLKWGTSQAPKPWKIGNVGTDPVVSIQGNPNHKTTDLADGEHALIEKANSRPWYIGVVLEGKPDEMHVRVYFENPPAAFPKRSISALPAPIQKAIKALPSGTGTGAIQMSTPPVAAPTLRAPKIVSEVLAALERDACVLLVGPPGTGKSIALEDLARMFSVKVPSGAVFFDATKWDDAFSTGATGESRSMYLVFHPAYGYENFVAGLYPKSAGAAIELHARPGPLLSMAHWIGTSDRVGLLIIDEFNRGPAAAIFGDMLALLDKDKRRSSTSSGSTIHRPFPGDVMYVHKDFKRNAGGPDEDVESPVSLPAGLKIVAAMNSTDRSVAPLDAAMRRRFAVVRVSPDYEVLADHFGWPLATLDARARVTSNDITSWQPEDVAHLALDLIRVVNSRIEVCLGEDFLLGQAMLWSVKGATAADMLTALAAAFDLKITATLRTTLLDQDDVLAPILGVTGDKKKSATEPAAAYWAEAPAGFEAVASRRLVLPPVRSHSPEDQLKVLRALAWA